MKFSELIYRVILGVAILSLDSVAGYWDDRDGHNYRTVKIGGQEWMAENLDYDDGRSFCYNDDSTNCIKYGRLYHWETAKRACPSGWSLPSVDQAKDLLFSVKYTESGLSLKSAAGWNNNGGGSDDFGFTAKPGGILSDDGYVGEGFVMGFWTSSAYDEYSNVDVVTFSADSIAAFISKQPVGIYHSVRCIKEPEDKPQYGDQEPAPSKEPERKPTFICNDGSPSYSRTRQGACSGHGGIKYDLNEERNEEPQYGYQENVNQTLCNDGTLSNSTGRGTCSHHGGVASQYKKEESSSKSDAGGAFIEGAKDFLIKAVQIGAQLFLGVQNSSSGNNQGTRCNDGTNSNSTGRGTCSHHGGIDRN